MVLLMPAPGRGKIVSLESTCSNSVYPDYDIYFTINILLCRAFVEIDSPLARAFVAFYIMINTIVIFFCIHGDMSL